ncbi:MAG: MarR family transcriptional regulator [Pseudomonadota bacterium]
MQARTIYLIKRVEVAIRLRMETELKVLDLTPSQYTTLSILASHADATSSDLARRVLVTPQSMSEMIIALGRKGLIHRSESPGNRRMFTISLSAAGLALLEKAEARIDDVEKALFSPLSDVQLHELRSSLETVLVGTRDHGAKRKTSGRAA